MCLVWLDDVIPFTKKNDAREVKVNMPRNRGRPQEHRISTSAVSEISTSRNLKAKRKLGGFSRFSSQFSAQRFEERRQSGTTQQEVRQRTSTKTNMQSQSVLPQSVTNICSCHTLGFVLYELLLWVSIEQNAARKLEVTNTRAFPSTCAPQTPQIPGNTSKI